MNSSNIAFQGLPGSFTYLAAQKYFGNSAQLEGQKNFKEIFHKVSSAACGFGVVPLENSLAGSVHEVYDLLWNFNLQIVGEYYLRINHHLLAPKSGSGTGDKAKRIQEIIQVFSHPKALEQCQRFFEDHPHIEKAIYSDTAGASLHVSESKDNKLAAIGSREAAALYNLEILEENLEDNPNNFTRFIIITKTQEIKLGSNEEKALKSSLIFTLPNTPSSLFHALETLAIKEINMVKIESRPIPGKPFEYLFYIDFEVLKKNYPAAEEALKRLRTKTLLLRHLGVYEAAVV